ncbi:uncharacterized protein LOC135337711 isoform X2 [Halichondria panicea]|uniref:uncharacterized protein LOC135337711 isoform X2 n=1 Tax=Halichondria panicea TaxID=6063 RepID=UPI00312B3AB0
MSDYLTDADLAKVYRVTFDARTKWRNILLALNISSATIDSIGTKWQDNPDDCYREGLLEWLKGWERSWESMVEALCNPTVGHVRIAKTIERDHVQSCTGEDNPTDVKPDENDVSRETSATEDIKHMSDPGPMPSCKMAQDLLKSLIDAKVYISGEPLLSKDTQQEVCDINEVFSQKSVLISVFGLHNAGKSTLINTLLGNTILPENMINETGVTVKIEPIQGKMDTTPVLEVENDTPVLKVENDTPVLKVDFNTPVLEMENDDMVIISIGTDSITETIKELNKNSRRNDLTVPDSVVLRVSAPELFGGVEEGWQVCLLDNPGLGEDSKCVQKVAMAAVASSAAYVFLTTTDSIGGVVNADFFRDLNTSDRSAFFDGRLIVAITKMDFAYQTMEKSDKKKLEELIKIMCESISKVTSIPMCKISTDIVLPISCVWYQNSRRLADTSLEEEGKHKENAIRSLYNYPYLEIEKTGQGMSPHQSLQDLSSSGIVRHLEDASGLLVLAARIKKIMRDTCVSTWRTKVLIGYNYCLTFASSELQIHTDRISKIMKGQDEELTCIQSVLAKAVAKKEELSHCLSEPTQKEICQDLEKQFDQDLFTGTLKEKVTKEVKKMLEKFKEDCVSRIQKPLDTFGPREFETDLESFLKNTSTRINEFMNTTLVFTALPQALQTRNDLVERIHRDLCVSANSLCLNIINGKMPEGHEDSLPSDLSTERNPEKPLINLADLKNEIFIPPVTLSVWEKIKQFIRIFFRSPPSEQQNRYNFEKTWSNWKNARISFLKQLASVL